MTTPTYLWQALTAALTRHGDTLVFAGLAVTVAILAAALYVAWRRGRVDRWVSALAWIASFGFSAEGMWVVTTHKAHVPAVVAVGVFFVAEAFQLSSMLQAGRRYRLDGHPGKHGRAVWIIAVAAGTVVAFSAQNLTEAALRFLIPLGAALLWWNTLTDAGMTKPKGRWRWTPTRLLEWLGAIEPDVDRDLVEVNRGRHVAAMVTAAIGVHDGGRLRRWHTRRLRSLAKVADEAMVAEVRDRVGRALRIVELAIPQPEVPAEVPAVDLVEVPVQVPAEVGAEVPTTGSVRRSGGGSARKVARKKPEVRARRSADETRKLAAELTAAQPTLTQAQIAEQLQISDRRLREVLAAPAAEPAKTNGHAVPELIPTGGTQ